MSGNNFMGGEVSGVKRKTATRTSAGTPQYGTKNFDAVPPMDSDSVNGFLKALMENRVITSAMVGTNDLAFVFFPLFMGVLSDYSKAALNEIAFVYGIVGEDETAAMAMNGWPMFLTCRVMLKSDWEQLKPRVDDILAAKAALTGQGGPTDG